MDRLNLLMPFNPKANFSFNQTPKDFIVKEEPLYSFSGDGEHLILKVRKRGLSTWEMIDIISNEVGVPKRDIGYAGLKDKNALTIQYISIPKKYQSTLKNLSHPDIKILDSTYHNNKIRVGHLKGNYFEIRLKKVLGASKDKIDSTLDWIESNGLPNYFGYQRFGVEGRNYIDGKKILDGELKLKDKKLSKFLVSAYQSFLFNNWLSKRIELSRVLGDFSEDEAEKIFNLKSGSLKGVKSQESFFKILRGDLMMHYPFGRVFFAKDLEKESQRFKSKDISPTGALFGKRVKLSEDVAFEIEKNFLTQIKESGSRRYAWIFPKEIKKSYIPQKAHYEMSFFLPKGSYATVVIDFLKGN